MPRKTKLTAKLIETIKKLLVAGNYVVTICDYVKINDKTWYNWLKRGREQAKGLYRDFYEMVKQASSMAEIDAVTAVRKAGQTDWKAAMTFLERRYPDRWGKHGFNLSSNEPIEINITPTKKKKRKKSSED